MFGLRWYNAKKTPVWHVWPEMAPSPHRHTLSKRPLSGMFGLRWFIPHTAHLQKKTPVWNVWPEMAPSPHRHPAPHSQVPTHSPSQHLSSSPTILYSLRVSLPPSPFSPLLPPYIVNSSSYHILHPPPSTPSESPLYSEEIWLIVK